MDPLDTSRLAPLFFTGTSPFLVANENLVRAMIRASTHSALHASENIYDANGMLLWASGRAVDEHLLERLAERRLRKPVELCVYASEGDARHWMRQCVQAAVDQNENLAAITAPHLPAVLRVLDGMPPAPSELMLHTVLRHGGEDRLRHAATVAAIALAFAIGRALHPELLRPLARAAFLHDVGLLYLIDAEGRCTPEQYRQHPHFGARVALELAHSSGSVARMIASSHERQDGWGYPRHCLGDDLSLPERLLLFAEAIAPSIESGPDGLRRASVMARLLPGEFDPELVDDIGRLAPRGPVQDVLRTLAWPVSLGLRQIHSVLDTLAPLLASPREHSRAVREAAGAWGLRVQALRQVLDSTGVAEEIREGGEVVPGDLQENFELMVVSEELLHRVRDLRQHVAAQRSEDAALETSSLVIDVLDALEAADVDPPGVQAGHGGVLRWSRILSVGVDSIDEQHKVLIGLVNRLHQAATQAPQGRQQLCEEVLGRLADYVREHFAYEESLMAQYHIPDTAVHFAEHEALRQRVAALGADAGATSADRLEALTHFLRSWLVSHVLQTDKALGRALRAAGAV